MLVLRSLLFSLAFYLTTAVFTILGCPLLLGPRRYAMMGLKLHARCCLWLLRTIAGTSLEVRGREFIPAGAAIVASKHQSTWETFALIPLLPDPAMVMKAELGWIPFYGWFAHKFGHIFVARERGPAALRRLIADAKSRAAGGRQIVIFPEGTRQAAGAPPSYKSGVIALYEGLGLPCVPVALNSGSYWPAPQHTEISRIHRGRVPSLIAGRTGPRHIPPSSRNHHRTHLRKTARRSKIWLSIRNPSKTIEEHQENK